MNLTKTEQQIITAINSDLNDKTVFELRYFVSVLRENKDIWKSPIAGTVIDGKEVFEAAKKLQEKGLINMVTYGQYYASVSKKGV